MIIQIDSGYLGKDMMLWHGISSCYCTGPSSSYHYHNIAVDWIWISARIIVLMPYSLEDTSPASSDDIV